MKPRGISSGIRWCNPSVTFGDSSPFRGATVAPPKGAAAHAPKKASPERGGGEKRRRGSLGGSTAIVTPQSPSVTALLSGEPQSRPRKGQQRMRRKNASPERGGGAKRRRGSRGGSTRYFNPSVTFGDSSPFRGAISRPRKGQQRMHRKKCLP